MVPSVKKFIIRALSITLMLVSLFNHSSVLAASPQLLTLNQAVVYAVNNSYDMSYFKNIKDKVEALLYTASKQSAAADGSSSGSGSGTSANNSAALLAALSAKIDQLFAQAGIDGNSSRGQLIQLVLLNGLSSTAEFASVKFQIKSIQDKAANALEKSGSKFISQNHISSGEVNYISLKELAALSSMRYVWNTKASTASIAKGASTFVFSSGSKKVIINKKSKDMPAKAFFKESIFYVPLTFTANQLDLSWSFVGSKSKLLVYPKSIDTIVKKMLK